jgi:very-short-patch-repair endonuclease
MKHKKLPAEILHFARSLRGTQTDAENLLWLLLRSRRLAGFKFRRQHPIGGYILDFYCHEPKLVIEIDDGGHNEDATRDYDRQRTMELEGAGLMVIRFWNNDVLTNIEGVLETIYQLVLERSESPSPPNSPSSQPFSQGEKGMIALSRRERVADRPREGSPSPSLLPTGEGGRRPDEGERMHSPAEKREFMTAVVQGFADIGAGRTLNLADAKIRLGLP